MISFACEPQIEPGRKINPQLYSSLRFMRIFNEESHKRAPHRLNHDVFRTLIYEALAPPTNRTVAGADRADVGPPGDNIKSSEWSLKEHRTERSHWAHRAE